MSEAKILILCLVLGFLPYFARTGQRDGSLHKCDTKILQKINEQAGFNQAGVNLIKLLHV